MSVLLQQIESEGEEDPETILDGMPIPKELCSVRLWEVETNQSLLQASAHIDNMRALHFLSCSDKLGSLTSTPDNILAHHYHAASQSSAGIFIGCVAETVRSFLAKCYMAADNELDVS